MLSIRNFCNTRILCHLITVYSTSYKPLAKNKLFQQPYRHVDQRISIQESFYITGIQTSVRTTSFDEWMPNGPMQWFGYLDRYVTTTLTVNWMLDHFTMTRMMTTSFECRLEEYEDDNTKKVKRFGDWMHVNSTDHLIGWWIPTMTPKSQASTKRRHLLIAIQVIACRHGSYSTPLLTIGQHSTSIHPSFSLSSPPHHLQCCISVLWWYFSRWIVVWYSMRDLIATYSNTILFSFHLANQLRVVFVTASLKGFLCSNTPEWYHYTIFFWWWARDTLARKSSSSLDDSFLVWLMHSQWYRILHWRCASGGWTRYKHNWIMK